MLDLDVNWSTLDPEGLLAGLSYDLGIERALIQEQAADNPI